SSDLHNQSGIAAVIERARAKLPGIEVRTEDDELVWLLAAFDFRDHVCSFDWAANLAGDTQVCPYRMPRGEQASNALSIFARHQHLRDAINFSCERIRVPVKNVVLARGDECDCLRPAT